MKASDAHSLPSSLLARLALARLPQLKAKEKLRLLPFLDSTRGLSLLSPYDLEAMMGRPLVFRHWDPEALWAAAEKDALLLESLGADFVCLADSAYPAALREIPGPPFGLYRRGRALGAEGPALAMVGTRYPTGAGLACAEGLATEAARLGLPVVSGLARGIDAASHRGALLGGGQTCAVLPCGIEAVYPQGNRGLASAILAGGGLLVSEYPPGTEIRKSRFPERNRIISGLSRGVLVVEAPANSGALITADFALEQGRDVFVAAARLSSPRSAGLDKLASEGARAIASATDIVQEWRGLPAACPALPVDVSGAWAEGRAYGLSLAASLRAELSLPAAEAL